MLLCRIALEFLINREVVVKIVQEKLPNGITILQNFVKLAVPDRVRHPTFGAVPITVKFRPGVKVSK